MVFMMVPEVSPVEHQQNKWQIIIRMVNCHKVQYILRTRADVKVLELWVGGPAIQPYLVSLGLHADLVALPAHHHSFHIQLLSIRYKTGVAGVKRAVLGLQALLLGFAEVGGRRPVLGHLCVAAHVGT